MATTSKPQTHSTSLFLSGEADPEAASRRQERLGGILSGSAKSSQSAPGAAAATSRTSILLGAGGGGQSRSSGKFRPRIQVVSETTNDDGGADGDGDGVNQGNCSDSDDDPPPLSVGAVSSSVENRNTAQTKATAAAANDDGPSLMEEMMADAAKVRKEREVDAKAKERRDAKNASFGMKKGFLNSSSSKPKRKKKKSTSTKKVEPSKDDDAVFEIDSDGNLVKAADTAIPTIRPRASASTSSSSLASEADRLRLQEVQEAMKNSSLEGLVGASGEWADDDLMEKVANNPRLAAGMRNPKFAAALEALQADPKTAMERFGDHPEIIDFLREFCGVMGQHFTKLGEEQEKAAAPAGKTGGLGAKKGKGGVRPDTRDLGPLAESAIKKQTEREANGTADAEPEMSREERETLDRITSDPELTSVLMDPDMQRVMQECGMPGRMRMYMEHTEYGPKLRKLLEAGILKLA